MNTKIYFYKKNSARKFCAYFIIKHHEMIGNRSSYDKQKNIHELRNKIMEVKNKILKIKNKTMKLENKKQNHENKKYIFDRQVPQENSVHISLLNIMK